MSLQDGLITKQVHPRRETAFEMQTRCNTSDALLLETLIEEPPRNDPAQASLRFKVETH
jgi:hypothetical protein